MLVVNQKKAFTLIELLVVVAIIGILASILFPVFARARENARRASCMSNMKQIGLAVIQYTQDYDEKYPVASTNVIYNFATTTTDSSPFQELYPYMKSWQILNCPSASPGTSSLPYGNNSTNYLLNGVIFRINTSLSMSAISQPSGRILLSEYSQLFSYSVIRPYAVGAAYIYWIPTNLYSGIHFDGGNLLFADGHAKWRKQASICASDFGLLNNTVSTGPACGVTTYSAYANVDPQL